MGGAPGPGARNSEIIALAWFSTNGSIADFLIVMAVTDPDARPHQRASMFIVDADTPGVQIVRDIATMEHPWESWGRYGNRPGCKRRG